MVNDLGTRYTYLPAGDDGEVHGCLNSLIARGLERLVGVADNVAEGLDIGRGDGDLGTGVGLVDVNARQHLVITEPEAPVEVLDPVVAVSGNLVVGCVRLLGLVGELKRERDRRATAFLEERDANLARGRTSTALNSAG